VSLGGCGGGITRGAATHNPSAAYFDRSWPLPDFERL